MCSQQKQPIIKCYNYYCCVQWVFSKSIHFLLQKQLILTFVYHLVTQILYLLLFLCKHWVYLSTNILLNWLDVAASEWFDIFLFPLLKRVMSLQWPLQFCRMLISSSNQLISRLSLLISIILLAITYLRQMEHKPFKNPEKKFVFAILMVVRCRCKVPASPTLLA